MKKRGALFLVILIVFVAMAAVIAKQHKTIEQYVGGFGDIIGTYAESENGQEEPLILAEDNKAYSYRQFGTVLEGTYAKTNCPNIYVLKMENQPTRYIILDKEGLSCVEGENAFHYVKLSRGAIYSNVEAPE